MSKQYSTIARQLSIPLTYIIFIIIFWKYAFYQGFTAYEFGSVITAGGVLAWLGWFLLNQPRKAVLISSASLVIVLLFALIYVYTFMTSLPAGWENIK